MTYCRHEYLGIYLIKNPRTKQDRETNAQKLSQAEAIRAMREISLINEQYGFLDRTRLKMSFVKYYEHVSKEHSQDWQLAFKHFNDFCKGECLVSEVTVPFCKRFMEYLKTAKYRNDETKVLSVNTQSTYWSYFKFALKRAFADKVMSEDLTPYLDSIEKTEVHREFLTLDEVRSLVAAPCKNETAKRASLFSCLSGLRMSDILALDWSNIRIHPDGGHAISIRTQKTKAEALLPISEEAYSLLGEPDEGLVFKDMSASKLARALPDWLAAAGITKHISFHCFRHTYATLLVSSKVPIYTVSAMMTHKNVSTTQIYAHMVDEEKRSASNAIRLRRASTQNALEQPKQ